MTELAASEPLSEQADVDPVPPRFWWLKRLLVGSAILLIALLAVRIWWGREADRQLQAEIDRIIESGEPIYPADFDPPEIRPEDNAAKLLLKAEAAINLTTDQSTLVRNLTGDYDDIRLNLDELGTIIEANSEAYQLVRKARDLPEVDWGYRIRSPAVNFMFGNLSAHRQLARMLSLKAVYNKKIGNEPEALATLLDAVRLYDAIDHEPFIIGHLVSTACRALLLRDIEDLAPTLVVSRDDVNHARATNTRKLAQVLLEKLLDEKSSQAAYVRAIQAERMCILDMAQLAVQGNMRAFMGVAGPPGLLKRALVFPISPMLRQDALAGTALMSAYVTAAGQATYPSASRKAPKEPFDWTPLQRLVRPFSRYSIPSMRRTLQLHYRAVAKTRMAAISLAIRLYAFDHGERPAELDELVPDYLPRLPLDPFAADGRPIGYKPNAPKPLLCSVGKDGIDDGGAYYLNPRGGINRDKLDIPFFLDGDRPTRNTELDADDKTSAEGDDDDNDVGGDRRDTEEDESRED